ncbi:DUF4304 domain-containing protein [Pseudoalteromonas phenolica]|uniref:DUF4304 domain-containing protein n=1 Tax=Pseudoalteromonas phenolica TaxID=161398 RepID=UPI00110A918D|nr:DUF4304 domain-containing protein [Pseudoalteromonas phenolica]TMO58313.1 hypothetical protein CWC21_01135 [Pseudoalteromonas phenolica]
MQKLEMDKKLEKSNAGKTLTRFTNHIKLLGFKRVKPTFWIREKEFVVEFIHIHKYTFGPHFRIHTCIRPYNNSFSSVALSGPTERELNPDATFEYETTMESVEQCATKMASFVQCYSEAWFSKWADPASLLKPSSPLYSDQIEELQQAIEGNANPKWVELTKELLKIA